MKSKIKNYGSGLTLGICFLVCLTLLFAGLANGQVIANCNQHSISVSTHNNDGDPKWYYKLTTGDCENSVNWNSETDFDEAREGVKDAMESVKNIKLEGMVDLGDLPYVDGEAIEESVNKSLKKTEESLAKIDLSGVIESVDRLEKRANQFEKIEQELIKDGLVKKDENFKIELTDKALEVNGEKQSEAAFSKYSKLSEDEELPIVFKKSDKSPWDCD